MVRATGNTCSGATSPTTASCAGPSAAASRSSARPAGNTNGHTRDRQGRLISCSHGNRHVERTEHDGSITVLATHHDGKRLNSPNDVVVKSDGTIWFTDPAYGIESDLEGHKSKQEQDGCYVYCIDPKSGKVTAKVTDMDRPNGLAFSPDESILYVADSASSFGPTGRITSASTRSAPATS